MGLFGSNRKAICPVTEDDKNKVENIFERLIIHYGREHFISHPTITPSHKLYKSENPKELITGVISIINLDVSDFEIEFFQDHKSAVWNNISTLGKYKEEEFFIEPLKENSKCLKIYAAKSLTDDIEYFIGVAAEKLCLLKLNQSNFRIYKSDRAILVMKIASMFFGFGIASTNCTFLVEPGWTLSSPIMLEIASYAFALLTRFKKEEDSAYEEYMSTDAKPYFKKSFQYLVETNDTLLTDEYLNTKIDEKRLYDEASECYSKNDFENAVKKIEELSGLYPQNSLYHNNTGFYKLRLEKYTESIDNFNTAISLRKHPYYYDNLGFAQLMLGDLKEGYKNLMVSLESDSKNAFIYRNLGIYSTLINDFIAAKINFEKALTMDPKTELAHYYFALCKLKEGDNEGALNELTISASLGEPEAIRKLEELKS